MTACSGSTVDEAPQDPPQSFEQLTLKIFGGY
jgi:hypothetical protein